MFGRKQQPKDAVDVNDFIVNDSMQAGIHIDADLGSPVPSVDIPDDQIIDADYAEPTTRKRLKTSQVLILGAVAVFAVGGVASIFVSPQTQDQAPVAAASQPSQAATSPEPAAKLPPGLADPDQVQPPANLPGPVANAQGNVTPAALEPVVSPAAPAAVPATLATAAAPAAIAANTIASSPAPTNSAVPQVVEAKAQPTPVAPASTNPVSAQIAEAQKLSPVTQPVMPAAQPKASPVSPQNQATSKPVQPQAALPVPATPKPAPATVNSQNAEKKTVPPAKTVTPAQTKQVATTERETSEEGIKRLVTTSAEAFGLQSIQEGAITLEGRRGNAPQRLHVGDRLPSGEQILRIDARSMTLVTDRSVIRLN